MSKRISLFLLAFPLAMLAASAARAAPNEAPVPGVAAEHEHSATAGGGCAGCAGEDCAHCPMMQAAAQIEAAKGAPAQPKPCQTN
jgi:hypothetical protein